MKRFCWIEIALILASFLALINYYDYLSIAMMFLSIVFLLIVNRDFLLSRTIFVALVLDLAMYYLALYGGLFIVYPILKVLLALLSVHLALFSELLNIKTLSKNVLEPFSCYMVFAFIFMAFVIFFKDSTIFANIYPYGTLSLLTLVMLIFMPYLTTTTLTLVFNECYK